MTDVASPRIRPSGWWYALPAALVLVGVVGAVLLFAAAFDRFADVARADDGGVLSIKADEQLSVFADLPTAGTGDSSRVRGDFGGPGACSLTPVAGGGPVLTGSSSSSITFDEGNRHWVRIGVVPAGTPPGDYELVCAGIPPSDLAAASTDGIKDGALLAIAGVGVPVVATLAASVVLIVILVLRSRSKRRIQAAGYPGGYQPGYPRPYDQQQYVQPPGYGQQPPS